jgi:phage terminase Nu1 subunit (DNA packaging protein)
LQPPGLTRTDFLSEFDFLQRGLPLPNLPNDVTRGDLGRSLGLSIRSISDLAAKGILVRTGRGRFDLVKSVAQYCAHLRETAARWPDGEARQELAVVDGYVDPFSVLRQVARDTSAPPAARIRAAEQLMKYSAQAWGPNEDCEDVSIG